MAYFYLEIVIVQYRGYNILDGILMITLIELIWKLLLLIKLVVRMLY